jgi:hypothetical protein
VNYQNKIVQEESSKRFSTVRISGRQFEQASMASGERGGRNKTR